MRSIETAIQDARRDAFPDLRRMWPDVEVLSQLRISRHSQYSAGVGSNAGACAIGGAGIVLRAPGAQNKTPAVAGVDKNYFTTRNPGRLGGAPEGDADSDLGEAGGEAGAGGCGFCSGSNIMPWPFSRA